MYVKQGWVQQIYKYLLDFYLCSSCTSGLLEVYGKVRGEQSLFATLHKMGHLTTLFLLFRTEAKAKKGHE